MKYEYQTLRETFPFSRQQLNEQGKLGWELCSTVSSMKPSDSSNWPAVIEYVFKRQLITKHQ